MLSFLAGNQTTNESLVIETNLTTDEKDPSSFVPFKRRKNRDGINILIKEVSRSKVE